MKPVYIFTAIGYMLFAARSWIIGIIALGLMLGMFTTAGLIGKALVNNAVAAVGIAPFFTLPPMSQGDALSKLTFGRSTTSSEARNHDGDQYYVFTREGTVTNAGPWTYDEIQMKCYYKTGASSYEKVATGFRSLDLKPGQTITYKVDIRTKRITDEEADMSGIETLQCKVTPKVERTAFIQD